MVTSSVRLVGPTRAAGSLLRRSEHVGPISVGRLHTTTSACANPLPVTAHGPPPAAPTPAASQFGQRIERRRRQAEMLRRGQALRSGPSNKRFWKDVSVKHTPDGLHILLDSRPVRTPSKSILTIPHSKPHLASAIALEWDLLVSAQQALKQHLIPLTSLVSRAHDIRDQDSSGERGIRDEIVGMVMRYLDTDTLLCLAPDQHPSHSIRTSSATGSATGEATTDDSRKRESLKDIQWRVAQPIIAHLTMHVWPGAEIRPVEDTTAIVPPEQPQATKAIIRGWVTGLPAYELAALERGVLACKSLLGAARFLVEWSPEWDHLRRDGESRSELGLGETESLSESSKSSSSSSRSRFGIEEAAEAASVELRWQTRIWGEVEDTHDVEREDLKRQLGQIVILLAEQQPQSDA
ncbi:MAG: hypothetical protein M1825_000153 [Sarcosagium campestre]|nr:MAG: hypothetical protein M1825_000153 [Sarcosagium campestre]